MRARDRCTILSLHPAATVCYQVAVLCSVKNTHTRAGQRPNVFYKYANSCCRPIRRTHTRGNVRRYFINMQTVVADRSETSHSAAPSPRWWGQSVSQSVVVSSHLNDIYTTCATVATTGSRRANSNQRLRGSVGVQPFNSDKHQNNQQPNLFRGRHHHHSLPSCECQQKQPTAVNGAHKP